MISVTCAIVQCASLVHSSLLKSCFVSLVHTTHSSPPPPPPPPHPTSAPTPSPRHPVPFCVLVNSSDPERSWTRVERSALVVVLGLELVMGVVGNCTVLLIKIMVSTFKGTLEFFCGGGGELDRFQPTEKRWNSICSLNSSFLSFSYCLLVQGPVPL